MALQGSGAISISQINSAVTAADSNSLRTLSSAVGKGTPDSMSEFYGYSALVPVTFNVYQNNDGVWWSPCPGYGGWLVDHWAYVGNPFNDTITFGNESRNYTGTEGDSVTICSSLRHMSYDAYCSKVYRVYVALNGSIVSYTDVGQGGDGDSCYTFTLQKNTTYNFTCNIQDVT